MWPEKFSQAMLHYSVNRTWGYWPQSSRTNNFCIKFVGLAAMCTSISKATKASMSCSELRSLTYTLSLKWLLCGCEQSRFPSLATHAPTSWCHDDLTKGARKGEIEVHSLQSSLLVSNFKIKSYLLINSKVVSRIRPQEEMSCLTGIFAKNLSMQVFYVITLLLHNINKHLERL